MFITIFKNGEIFELASLEEFLAFDCLDNFL
jgi:hypothetical protein